MIYRSYPVVATRYITGDVRSKLTHITARDADGWHVRVLCNRVKLDSILLDEALSGEPWDASCPQCRSRWARIGMGDVAAPEATQLEKFARKTDTELRYILKDASAAALAMKGVDSSAEAKYLDQVNDASTILARRAAIPFAQLAENGKVVPGFRVVRSLKEVK